MVAKSEASMPMSRALAKLAVATDLGTAARPSTAAPSSGPAAAARDRLGSGGAGGGKAPLATSSGRALILKPSAARSALASLPLPLANTDFGNKGGPGAATAVAAAPGHGIAPGSVVAAPLAAAVAAAAAAAAGSGAPSASPSTPRLPPLSSHCPPSSPPPAAAAAVAPFPGSQLPPAAPAAVQQAACSAPSHHHHHYLPSSQQPLPPCGGGGGGAAAAVASCGPGAPPGGTAGVSKELRDAARKHPGLPASLLAQLHHPHRQHGAGPSPTSSPSYAPFAGAAAVVVPPPPRPCSGASAGNGVRPLSPRSRARMTASMVNGGDPASAGTATLSPPTQQLAAPPPAALSGLSPEALAVLLAAPSQPPAPSGGLLVMRRAGPAAVGAALRPSTAQSGGGGGGRGSPAAAGAATGVGSGPAGAPLRPPVTPHITVPYKPGSVRLPPGGVPGFTAAVALGPSGKATGSGPGSAAGSGTGSPALSGLATAAATAAAAAAAAAPSSDLLRPWTSAPSASTSALRPPTANPLTHVMSTDSATMLVVRMPRSVTEAPGAAPPVPGAATAARPGVGMASAPGTSADGGGGGGYARQLTAQELRAVVAALAASRPEAAAMLLSRPATAADPGCRPATGASHQAGTRAGVSNTGGGCDVTAHGGLRDLGYLYGMPDGTSRDGSRPSSRATTRGSFLSGGTASTFGVRDPSIYDDKWPRPTSGASRPRSRGGADAAPPSAGSAAAGGGDGGGGSSRGGNAGSRRPAISAWGSRQLLAIPEDAELSGGEEEQVRPPEATGTGGRGDDGLGQLDPNPLRPLEPLDPDPELDASWASIVAANQRPDTAAARTPSSGINVLSRPPTGAIRVARQAAPMVLVVEDITASTPEVLERELEALSLEELRTIRNKLSVT